MGRTVHNFQLTVKLRRSDGWRQVFWTRGCCCFWGLSFKKVGKDKSYVHWMHGLAGGMVILRGSFGRLPPAPHLAPAAVGSSPKGVLCFFW